MSTAASGSPAPTAGDTHPPRSGPARPARRPRRRRRFGATIVGALLAVLVAATARLFVFPTTDPPTRVDAIVLLGGVDGTNGMARALHLVREHVATQLVVSAPGNVGCPRRPIAHVSVTCFYPHPTSTQGEAQAIGRFATERHWKRILVVTRRAQDTRTRLRVERCYPGHLLINTVSPALGDWPYQLTYEWGAMAKALLWQRGC